MGGGATREPSTQSSRFYQTSGRGQKGGGLQPRDLMPSSPATSSNREGSGSGGSHTSSTADIPWQLPGLCCTLTPALGEKLWLAMSTPGTDDGNWESIGTCSVYSGTHNSSEGLTVAWVYSRQKPLGAE